MKINEMNQLLENGHLLKYSPIELPHLTENLNRNG